ncbi:unnamed protein product [Clonostachys solani]|uniref:Nephrocystin 3-like N-terminal domain-containing protein n=1 Tax=Clonostachys solani TaxID=160281 RepID=A0A9N9ZE87_9HYPO|nr:unnamed protein product [Clonostachys solani]
MSYSHDQQHPESVIAKPKCYRIQMIPSATTEDQVKKMINDNLPTPLDGLRITLAPSPPRWLTSTVVLREALKTFEHPVDDDFIGITPFYGNELSMVDIITVPGLGSNAFSGFKVKNGTANWIRDFLPEDIPKARLLTYGYASSLAATDAKYSVGDLAKTFLDSFITFREDTNTSQRPIILIGHSLGGLVIKEALAIAHNAASDDRYGNFCKSSYGFVFFGVPNHGIRRGSLKDIVVGQPNEQLIHDLEVDSEGEPTPYLRELKKKFLDSCKSQAHPSKVILYYELRKTPSIKRADDGAISASGDPKFMVTQDSACQIGLEDNEINKHAIDADHSNLVKFANQVDANYSRVLSQLKRMVTEAPEVVLRRFEEHRLSSSQTGASNQSHHIAQDEANVNPMLQPGNDEDECIRELFLTSPASDRDEIITAKGDRVDGTCEWITSTVEYTEWMKSTSGLLWIVGGPGKGKTFLSIYLTEILDNAGSTLIYFFCDNKISSRNTPSAVLRGIMHQLIERHPRLVKHLVRPWQLRGSALFSDSGFESLWGIFQSMVEDLKGLELCCVLDGLDECNEHSLQQLLRKIESLFNEHGGKQTLKMIVVSRRHPNCLESTLGSFSQISLDSAHENNVKSDIDSYIAVRLADLTKKRPIPQSLANHIEETFHEKSQGTFLWVSFMMEDFHNKSVASIEKALDSLPFGLDEVYERILLQIQPENMAIITEILNWVALSPKPPKVAQLAEAVGIQASEHLSRNQICLHHIESCGHLLQVHDNDCSLLSQDGNETEKSMFNSTEKSSSTVTLVHQSAKDFLTQQNLSPRIKSFQVHEARGDLLIMERLLYLMQGDWIRVLPEIGFQGNASYPLLDYARKWWTYHLRQLKNKDLLNLVEKNKSFFADHSDIRDRWDGSEKGRPVLHFACEQGLVALVEKVLKRKRRNPFTFQRYIDKPWPDTPLAIAIDCRHDTLVEMLLKFGAIVKRHHINRAAFSDHLNIFELLSETKSGKRFIKRDLASRRSLMYIAIRMGDEKLCRLLLERYGYNVDALTVNQSPLLVAISWGHYEIARVLAAGYGASTNNHDEIISALIEGYRQFERYRPSAPCKEPLQLIFSEWKVDINRQDRTGRTILHLILQEIPSVSEDGYKLLRQCLADGCDPTLRTMEGESPLHSIKWFAPRKDRHYREMGLFPMRRVILLMVEGGLDINNPGKGGILPLHRLIQDAFDPMISQHKVDSAAKIKGLSRLLDLGADRNIKTSLGLTAVQVAKQCYDMIQDIEGHEGYCAETLAEITDVLENYATVTNAVQNLAYAGFESSEGPESFGMSDFWKRKEEAQVNLGKRSCR